MGCSCSTSKATDSTHVAPQSEPIAQQSKSEETRAANGTGGATDTLPPTNSSKEEPTYKFSVDLERNDSTKALGMTPTRCTSYLVVKSIEDEDGLVAAWNLSQKDNSIDQLRPDDRIHAVNGASVLDDMLRVIADPEVKKLTLSVARVVEENSGGKESSLEAKVAVASSQQQADDSKVTAEPSDQLSNSKENKPAATESKVIPQQTENAPAITTDGLVPVREDTTGEDKQGVCHILC